MIAVHCGQGVADIAHDAPAFAALATDRDVCVYDRIGPGTASPPISAPFLRAKFVMVPAAGHVAVNAFLTGQQLPLPTTDVSTVPAGYRGTP
jgi:hypothetical protein